MRTVECDFDEDAVLHLRGADEIGHHVQTQTGIESQVRQLQPRQRTQHHQQQDKAPGGPGRAPHRSLGQQGIQKAQGHGRRQHAQKPLPDSIHHPVTTPNADEMEISSSSPQAPVMPLHPESADAFIARGGRIPAPMQSLKN